MDAKSAMTTRSAGPTTTDWTVLCQGELPKVFHYFCYRVGDTQTAEDLTASTFEKAWRSRNRYRADRGNPSQWLFGIARHVAADYFRQNREHIPLENVINLATEESVEKRVQQQEDFQRLAALLGTLHQRESELIALKYGAGLTNRAIAELTGLSETNVGTQLHRTVKRLRDEWEKTP